ncbi:MAG: redoxin domain-containing protein [Bacteroidota bacterium]
MKRKLKYLIPIFLLSIIGWLGWQVQAKIQEKEAIEANRAQLPAFKFEELSGATFASTQLAPYKPVVVMFIHPECPHCQYEAEALYHQREHHQHIQWLLISEAPKEQLQWLSNTYKLDSLPNVSVLMSEMGGFYSFFGTESLPSTFVYDSGGRLKKYFRGEVKLEAIFKLFPFP